MTYLTKAEILAADDAKFAEVDVPEWGGKVRVRTISGTERDQFEEFASQANKGGRKFGVRGFLAALVICDESGKRVFDTKDIEALGNKNQKPLDRVWDVASSLNGLSEAAVEDAAKNSNGGQSEDSGSSLPAPSSTPALQEFKS